MAKRTRKPAVRPELARQWLHRFEQDGESPPQIAKADGYDVRTVRKQLQRMIQEREMREARQVVLRQALEKHYVDICAFAEKLRSEISAPTPSKLPMNLKDDAMYKALREHLPRSPLWKEIDRVESIAESFNACVDSIKQRVRSEAELRASMQFLSSASQSGFTEGLPESVVFHLESLARGGQGLSQVSYNKRPVKRLVHIEHGAFDIAIVPEEKAEEVIATSTSLLKEATDWQEYQELSRLVQDFVRIQQGLKEELTAIMLRRIVPGRCVYCPF